MFAFLEKHFKKALHALIILFAGAILFYFIDIIIPINPVTIGITITLGLPGVFLVILFALASNYFS